MDEYADFALLFKALSDGTRLKILDMLSCGELCACDLLKNLHVTQPTLSYHMKILTACELVHAIREGAWIHYTLNQKTATCISDYWNHLTNMKPDCICHDCHTEENSLCTEDCDKRGT